jgi:hypothetical protein
VSSSRVGFFLAAGCTSRCALVKIFLFYCSANFLLPCFSFSPWFLVPRSGDNRCFVDRVQGIDFPYRFSWTESFPRVESICAARFSRARARFSAKSSTGAGIPSVEVDFLLAVYFLLSTIAAHGRGTVCVRPCCVCVAPGLFLLSQGKPSLRCCRATSDFTCDSLRPSVQGQVFLAAVLLSWLAGVSWLQVLVFRAGEYQVFDKLLAR